MLFRSIVLPLSLSDVEHSDLLRYHPRRGANADVDVSPLPLLILEAAPVKVASRNAETPGHLGESVDRLRLGRGPADRAGNEPQHMYVGLHGVDPHPHRERSVHRGAEALDVSDEVLLLRLRRPR